MSAPPSPDDSTSRGIENEKALPFAHRAGHPHLPAVSLDDAFADGEAQAAAVDSGGVWVRAPGRSARTCAPGARRGCPRPGPPPSPPPARASSTAPDTLIVCSWGQYFTALSSRLLSTCSMRFGSAQTAGKSGGKCSTMSWTLRHLPPQRQRRPAGELRQRHRTPSRCAECPFRGWTCPAGCPPARSVARNRGRCSAGTPGGSPRSTNGT